MKLLFGGFALVALLCTSCGTPAESPWVPARIAPAQHDLSQGWAYLVVPWNGAVAWVGKSTGSPGKMWLQPALGTGIDPAQGPGGVAYGADWTGKKVILVGALTPSVNGYPAAAVWDGTTWSTALMDTTDSGAAFTVRATPAGFVAGGVNFTDGGAIWISADGLDWARADTPGAGAATNGFTGLALGGNTMVATVNTLDFWYSTDWGATWYHGVIDTTGWPAEWNPGLSPGLFTATYGNKRFVAVGFNGAGQALVAYSSDGKTWLPAPSRPPQGQLTGVAFGNDEFVTGYYDEVASREQMYYSRDGLTWIQQPVLYGGLMPQGGGFTYVNGTFYWGWSMY